MYLVTDDMFDDDALPGRVPAHHLPRTAHLLASSSDAADLCSRQAKAPRVSRTEVLQGIYTLS